MPSAIKTHSSIATDSEAELRRVIGDDSTATFEEDPTFVDSNPAADASSQNVAVQRDEDDTEDSDEEEEELDEDDDEDEELDEEDDEDEEDDDEEDEDDEEEGETDRVAEAALRMSALVAVTAEYAASV